MELTRGRGLREIEVSLLEAVARSTLLVALYLDRLQGDEVGLIERSSQYYPDQKLGHPADCPRPARMRSLKC